MRDFVGLACFIIGIVLVLIETADWFFTKFRDAPQTVAVQVDLPGGDIVKAIAEKSPRLAAALAFFILGSVINGYIALTASAGTG